MTYYVENLVPKIFYIRKRRALVASVRPNLFWKNNGSGDLALNGLYSISKMFKGDDDNQIQKYSSFFYFILNTNLWQVTK